MTTIASSKHDGPVIEIDAEDLARTDVETAVERGRGAPEVQRPESPHDVSVPRASERAVADP